MNQNVIQVLSLICGLVTSVIMLVELLTVCYVKGHVQPKQHFYCSNVRVKHCYSKNVTLVAHVLSPFYKLHQPDDCNFFIVQLMCLRNQELTSQ